MLVPGRRILSLLTVLLLLPLSAHGENSVPADYLHPQGRWGGHKADQGEVAVRQGSSILDPTVLGLSLEKRLSPMIRVGGETEILFRSYQTPPGLAGPFETVDDTMEFHTWGIGMTAVLSRVIGRLDLYAGASVGMYFSEMSVSGSVLGFPGRHEEDDQGLGTVLRAGFDYRFGLQYRYGFEIRKLDLNANFGPLSGYSSIPVGGTALVFSISEFIER